jgi:hypothetical protein
MGRIPDAVFDLLRVVMERPDFAALEWCADERRWYVGLFNGRTFDDGRKKITWHIAGRLSAALEGARAEQPKPAA